MNSFRIKNILVPIDFSEASLNALATAALIAKNNKAKLNILHVEDMSFDFLADEKSMPATVSIHSSEIISAIANSIHQPGETPPVILRKKGAVAPLIIRTAMEDQCDLIVMGTHGASGTRDFFIGTNTYSVMKYATCPVLSVPVHRKPAAFVNMLWPIRPVAGASRYCEVINRFVSSDVQLNILGLSNSISQQEVNLLEEMTIQLNAKLATQKGTALTSWLSGARIAEEVIRFASQQRSDLVIVTSGLDVSNKPHYIGPNAHRIISGVQAAVLVIRKIQVSAPAF